MPLSSTVPPLACLPQSRNAILRLSEDLPIVIEIVDSEEKIAKFLPLLDPMVKEGLVTLEKANVLLYRAG